jgi:hypothetical protein
MKFEKNKLTIYPIGLDSVPSRGGWKEAQSTGPRQPLVVPASPLKPCLIEGPIEIDTDVIPPPPDPRAVALAVQAANRNVDAT